MIWIISSLKAFEVTISYVYDGMRDSEGKYTLAIYHKGISHLNI